MSTAAPAKRSSRGVLPDVGIVAAIVQRDFAVTRSYRLPFILDAFFGILEFVVYFYISKTFGDVAPDDLRGAPSYFAFAAVGIIVGGVMFAATSSVASAIRQEQTTGTLEVLLTNPVRSSEICIGVSGFPFLYALARTALYLVVAGYWLDLDLQRTNWLGVVVTLLAVAFAMIPLGIVSGAVVMVIKRGDVVTSTLIYAMTIVCGAVFPVSVLPGWVQPIGERLPLFYAFEGVRDALFAGERWEGDAAALVAWGGVGLPLSLLLFGRAVAAAKRAGSLGQY